MRAVIQRVKQAQVVADDDLSGSIAQGYTVLLGICTDDKREDVTWLSNKIANLRLFADSDGVMNKNINDANGELLIISQFTLHAKYKKGNRPSYIRAARPEQAIPLYEAFIESCRSLITGKIETGVFGADMQIEQVGDGPVTLCIDTRNKE